MSAAVVTVRAVDYANPRDAAALVALLDAYASDPAGGGEPLAPAVKAQLPSALAQRAGAFSVIAWAQAPDGSEQAVGLVNCFEGFSTFACLPLVNVHDVAVLPAWRGQRVAQQMLAAVEATARARGACKLTLEVLQGNAPALRTYTREGFVAYALDPAWGQAQLMQKLL
ncbi:GNAT family N-acetyltransferase [Acidovorax sp. HDW3]|uniref:GNAT family N-acetyltransferase n=1 Tax=Acidovorax sp. HDW3 TaxID=2714923 RepID=UPI00140C50C3|nr:GNAT family N-acetyltransferase [Acidovorax sp. HDW3]QIL43546.1 GNAT family N-acetyltransferase [Acidovorax sp. HDW3]